MKQLKFIRHFLNHLFVENNSIVAKTEINVDQCAIYFVRAHPHLFGKLEAFLDIMPNSKLHIVLILVMFEISGKLIDNDSEISSLNRLRVKTICKVLLHKEYQVVTEQENQHTQDVKKDDDYGYIELGNAHIFGPKHVNILTVTVGENIEIWLKFISFDFVLVR